MKKFVAILFIIVYLFNLVGYTLLFNYFIYQTNQQTVQQLDHGNYNESELIEIKVPLNLPYYTTLNEYERFDGEIELNNIHYNFVKRKVYNDTLYLLCLANYEKTELYKAKNEFAVNQANSKVPVKKGMDSWGKKISLEKEHKQQLLQYSVLQVNASSCRNKIYLFRLTTCFIPFPAKPPEIIS